MAGSEYHRQRHRLDAQPPPGYTSAGETPMLPTILGGRVIRVTTEIENPEELLKPKMTGMAKVYRDAHRSPMWRSVGRSLLQRELWSWW